MERVKRSWLRGSMTVELAALFPMILLAVFGALAVSFLVHNRVWLTCAAYEAATVGVLKGQKEEEEGIQEAGQRANLLKDALFWGGREVTCQTKKEGEELSVSYFGRQASFYGGLVWDYRGEGRRRLLSPADMLRKQRLGKEGIEEITK